MWHWDQGRLAYFQFDSLRQIAAFVEAHDFKQADRPSLLALTGLPFAAPSTHSPWRNYSRVLKLCLLVSEVNGQAQSTPVAHILARPGAVTCDEYLHFLLSAFTEPAPALTNWTPNANFRYPLLFAVKYLLIKAAIGNNPFATIDEIIGAYQTSGFVGDEDQSRYVVLVQGNSGYEAAGHASDQSLRRQAAESLRVIAQISYLHMRGSNITVSLDKADAHLVFEQLSPIAGQRATESNAEIRRLAALFAGGSTYDFFDYSHTIINEVAESGFTEGSRVKKTHVTIERNAALRREFFIARPTSICDVCTLDTGRTYPWTERVIDLHHLLPLSSGTRVEANGTTFDDLVPVCPSCHRAIHRFYDNWLTQNSRDDFKDSSEARTVYGSMKSQFTGLIHA